MALSPGLWINESEFVEVGAISSAIDYGKLTTEIARRRRRFGNVSLDSKLPNPDPLLRKISASQDVYFELMGDAHLWGAIQSRKAGTLRHRWFLNADETNGVGVKECEAWLKKLPMRRIWSEGLNAAQFGFQPAEIVWYHTGYDIIPNRVTAKPYNWFSFNASNQLIFHDEKTGRELPVPQRKFIVFQHNATYDNPYGEAVLSKCFWPVQLKKGGVSLWVRFLEKYGMPWAKATYKRGTQPKEIDDVLDALAAMIHEGIIATPHDWNTEMMTAGINSGSSQLHAELIEWCNSEITKAELGHEAGSDSTPGKLGGEDTAVIVRQEIVESDRAMIEDGINKLIDFYYELNWGDVPRPRFECYLQDDVNQALATRDGNLAQQLGVKFKKTYVAKNFNIDEADFDLDENAGASQGAPRFDGASGTQSNGVTSIARNGAVNAAQGAFAGQGVQRIGGTPNLSATGVPRGFHGHAWNGHSANSARLSHAFAEANEIDQESVDEIFNAITPEQRALLMEKAFEPVFAFLEGRSSYGEAYDKLASTFADFDSSEFERMIRSALFQSFIIGRLSEAE
jgi:phage gp29-like protein